MVAGAGVIIAGAVITFGIIGLWAVGWMISVAIGKQKG